MATEFRQQFAKDVVIDMFCYRRFGHNEGDDPTMTQPLMYKRIRDLPSTREIYGRRLAEEGVCTTEQIDAWVSEFDAFLDEEFEAAKTYLANKADWLDGKWSKIGKPDIDERGETGVRQNRSCGRSA